MKKKSEREARGEIEKIYNSLYPSPVTNHKYMVQWIFAKLDQEGGVYSWDALKSKLYRNGVLFYDRYTSCSGGYFELLEIIEEKLLLYKLEILKC